MTIEEAITAVTYKVHLLIGAITGVGVSFLLDNLEDIMLTGVLAATGSVTAGLVNYFFWSLKRRRVKREEKRKEREDQWINSDN